MPAANSLSYTLGYEKIVVFDLDETLGYYTEFGMFWDSIKENLKSIKSPISLNQEYFNDLLDLYPEFHRPNIIKILNYLKDKKTKKDCHKLMIYTNNQGPNDWVKMLISYFETKINFKLFDQIICAFKIQGKQVEKKRTTHLKTYTDLLKCANIPDNTHICFIDDVYYPGMCNDNVYYINLKPYEYNLKFELMIKRFIDSNLIPDLPTSFNDDLLTNMKRFGYTYVGKTEHANNVDKIVSKKILQHLHVFFNRHNGNNGNNGTTRRKNKHKNKNKNKHKNKNKTRKNK